MLGHGSTVPVLVRIVTVKRLSCCIWSDAKDDRVHQLWEAHALFNLLSNLEQKSVKLSVWFQSRKGYPVSLETAREQLIAHIDPKAIANDCLGEGARFPHHAIRSACLRREEISYSTV